MSDKLIGSVFLSTLSLRRATIVVRIYLHSRAISIHALLAESDLQLKPPIKTHRHFYPRSPCGERRYIGSNVPNFTRISIHALLAESDELNSSWISSIRNFYPRSPCGERPLRALPFFVVGRYFYPRSPCGERRQTLLLCLSFFIFLSTLSLRRATSRRALGFVDPDISIHALLAESDSKSAQNNGALLHI